jgi:ribosomal protein S18 acetylase RimI-like enzyme
VPIELRSARSLTPGERAELFNAAYQGYVVPFHLDETMLARMDEAFDMDLDASRIAYRSGRPIGLANLGVRGEDGWIGGVGVVASARRSGVGRELMDAVHAEARVRGLRRVWLEVIDANTAAIALYRELGYEHVRDLEVWSLAAADDEADGVTWVDAADAQARIRELRQEREPWQRSDETLAHYGDARGVVSARGTAIFRVGASVQLVQVAGEAEGPLRALRGLGTVSVLNLPPEDPAAGALRSLGATVTIRQHEMVLAL